MIHSSRFIAVLDANVLYPASLRNYLLYLAAENLYKPKWSGKIHEEWIKSLLKKRSDISRGKLLKTKEAMNSAFDDADITNYEDLIESLTLPDPNDRHILAAAIRGKADVIVTFNLKDFPKAYLASYDIEAQHPDEFVSNLINLDKAKSEQALLNLIANFKNPPINRTEFLQTLFKCGLAKSVAILNSRH